MNSPERLANSQVLFKGKLNVDKIKEKCDTLLAEHKFE